MTGEDGNVAWRSGFLTAVPLAILLIGLALRFLLAPLLSYPFDQTYWSYTIANAEAGFGLYGLPAYFYTPVWGYLLGFDGLIMNTLTDLGEMGYRFVDLVGIEAMTRPYYTATINSPEFSVLVKTMMIVVDAVVGYMIYRMTLSSTGSQKSATLAFGLWFLCPVVVYMSGIQAQFDCISAMLALLSVLLLEKDHTFLAGMMFGVAALTKLFPAALIFVLVIYVIRKNPGSLGTRRLVLAIAGALAAFAIIYAPQIIEGTFMESMSFIISRASEEATIEQTAKLIGLTGLSVLIILAASFKYWRLPAETAVSEFRRFALLVLAGAAIMSTGPQYCIVCLPLLAYYAVSHDRALIPWTILLGTFAVITAFFNNGLTLLAMGSEYLGLIEPSALLDLLESMDQPIFMDLTLRSIPVVIADLGVTACLLFISAFLWIGKEGMPSHRKIESVVRYVKAFGRRADGA